MIGGAVNLYLYSYILKCCLHIFSKKRKLLSARICKPAKCQPFSILFNISITIRIYPARSRQQFFSLCHIVLFCAYPAVTICIPHREWTFGGCSIPIKKHSCKFFLIYRTCYSFSDIGILKTLCCIVHLRKK